MTTTEIRVSGVSCGHCTGTIERELGEMEGVRAVRAGIDGRVSIDHDPAVAPRAGIEALLREINYPPVEGSGAA